MGWTAPSDERVREILRQTRRVAVLGASANPARPSFEVAAYLLSSTPYEVSFVNPNTDSVHGRQAYPSLADLPEPPDLVTVFRRYDDLPASAEDVVAAGAKTLWLQLGLWHEPVAQRAEEAGLSVVMDRCLKVEHARLCPS